MPKHPMDPPLSTPATALLFLLSPLWLGSCGPLKGTDTDTYPGARSQPPDTGWRLKIERVDWSDKADRTAKEKPAAKKKN